MYTCIFRGLVNGLHVGQGKSDFNIIPVFGTAHSRNSFVVPLPLAGQNGGGNPVLTLITFTGRSPFAVGIQTVTMMVQFSGALYCRYIGYGPQQLVINNCRVMINAVTLIQFLTGKKAIKIPFSGQCPGQLIEFRIQGGCRIALHTANFPVAPDGFLLAGRG